MWVILSNADRAGDRALQLSLLNEEFLVNAVHQTVLNALLPFVHTARRFYRLSVVVSTLNLIGIYLFKYKLEKLCKPLRLEKGEVVTRYLLVNQQMDHYK